MCFRLTPTEITYELKKFLTENDASNWNERMRAIDHTLQRHAEEKLVAWRMYYERAGVAIPTTGMTSFPKPLPHELKKAEALVAMGVWRPRSGLTDRSVFTAVLDYASRYGKVHELGFSVCVSTRELALYVNVSHTTLLVSLKRLQGQGLIQRIKRPPQPSASGVLAVCMRKVSKLYQSAPQPVGGVSEWISLEHHPVFRHGKLNKSAVGPLAVLSAADTALPRSEIARRLGKKSRTLAKPLEKLLKYKIIVQQEFLFALAPNWKEALDQAAFLSGARLSHEQDRVRYERDRELYREWQGRFKAVQP